MIKPNSARLVSDRVGDRVGTASLPRQAHAASLTTLRSIDSTPAKCTAYVRAAFLQ